MDRYEEALERAKKGLPIDEVFPELKESEDERIRKELLEEIEFIIPHDDETDSEGLILPSYHARIDRYKSYLEKQKEQKPAEWKPQPESLEALMYAIEGKWEAIKPTSYLSRRLEDLYDGLVNTFNVDESFIAHENDYVSKSAEWSEEDEKNLERVTDCIYDFYPDPVVKYKLKDWLKSLRPQPHWKPSEEQMKALKAAIDSPTQYQCIVNKLKTLYDELKKL